MRQLVSFKAYIRHIFVRYILALIVLMMTIFLGFMLFHYEVYVVRESRQASENLCTLLTAEWQRYNDGLQALTEDELLRAALEEPGDLAALNRRLYEFSFAGSLKSDFILLDAKQQVVTSSLYKENQELFLMNRSIQTDLQSLHNGSVMSASGVLRIPFSHGQEADYVFMRAVTHEGRRLGYLIFSLKEDSFSALAGGRSVDQIAIMDAFDYVIFSTNRLLIDPLGKFAPEVTEDGQMAFRGRPSYMVTKATPDGRIRVAAMTSVVRQKQLVQSGLLFLLCISGLLLLGMPFFVRKITGRSLRSIDGLLYAVRECRQGNMHYRLRDPQSFQEFRILYEDFNNMMREIRHLIKRNEELAERKRLMEVRQLKGQFNPHFAFNVLEALRYEILIHPQQAADMVVAFANLMRYSIHYGSSCVPLGTDIHYVQDYLRLQKMRYGQRLQYVIDIPDALMSCLVPKLLVQPIVENSIVHGLEQTRRLLLELRGWQEGGDLLLSVTDDGPGLTKEKQTELQALLRAEDAEPEHIGLYNVHRALRLLYGEAYGLQLESRGRGVCVVLRMPLSRGREENV